MDTELTSSMVPPSNPGPGLGFPPNPALSQENYPSLSQASPNKRQRADSDDHNPMNFFKPDNFPKFIVIKSNSEKAITSFSPFVIEKQIEAAIGTAKCVKKLKNQTLLVETSRKSQSENLLKMKQFFNIPVTVSEHTTLNSSKGIIKDRTLKGESEADILAYLKPQGVTAVKRFRVRKGEQLIETNTLLLTFNMVTVPKSLRIFYRMVPVEIYVPNPLRCYNCQKYNHHEDNCPEDLGSICENCGMGGHDHLTSRCKNPTKCVNCGKDHLSRSNTCEVWMKEKEIMKIKVTNNITYLEAKKIHEHKPEFTFSKIVQSTQPTKPESKTIETQFAENDFNITASAKVMIPTKYKPKNQSTKSPTGVSSSQSDSSKLNNANEKSRSRSKTRTRTTTRDNSKSPKTKQKEKANVKLTRLPDQSVKTANKYGQLESMES